MVQTSSIITPNLVGLGQRATGEVRFFCFYVVSLRF